MKRDKATYGRIGRKFEEWEEIQASRPAPAPVVAQRPYTPEPAQRSDMNKLVFAAIGVGIGLLILVLAVLAFVTAARWGEIDRYGAATGYTVVGFFLTLSGVGGILATLNHNFRVLNGAGRSHH